MIEMALKNFLIALAIVASVAASNARAEWIRASMRYDVWAATFTPYGTSDQYATAEAACSIYQNSYPIYREGSNAYCYGIEHALNTNCGNTIWAYSPAGATPYCRKEVMYCPSTGGWTLFYYNPWASWLCSRADAVAAKGYGPSCPQPETPHPITIGTGNKWVVENDLGNGRGDGVRFSRVYNSGGSVLSSALGAHWQMDYFQRLGSDGSNFWAYRPDGKIVKYANSGSSYLPDGDIANQLFADRSAGISRLQTENGGIERYDGMGKLLWIADRFGRVQTLVYSDGTNGIGGGVVLKADGSPTTSVLPSGYLIRVTDTFGRSLSFGYDSAGRVVKLMRPDGKSISYTFDANGNLAGVGYPDGRSKTYHYGELDHTSSASLPNALTGITDENGVRYIDYYYDSEGRANEELSAVGGANVSHYALSFSGQTSSVTDPLGAVRSYTFSKILSINRMTGQSQPGGSGCGPASASLTYDANGNVASRTDFNGVQTTYSYDLSRNLETQRVEASGKAEARTISTQWHGIWRLPVKVAEPNKLTTYIYNGDTDNGSVVNCAPVGAVVPMASGNQPIGVLCKKTEQATGDANGSAGFGASGIGARRTSSWTYNQYGQVLTADGPRSDVPDLTTFTYYDAADPDMGKRGNLATVTNALGHVTQITAYDLNGNPLTLIDPNGTVTTLTYDARQRLTSRSVGNELTGYQYDGVGQLTRVTLPDGSYLSYTYDAAHRLTGISDSLGNQILYTLDAMGNRINEEVKDPQGALARTRARVYDALNRLQTLTGVGE